MSYLVAAWTQRPEDEHRLLASLLRCFLRYEALPEDVLSGRSQDLGLPVPLTVAYRRQRIDRSPTCGPPWVVELKPSLDVVVTAPIDSGQSFPAGPPVKWSPTLTLEGIAGTAPAETLQRGLTEGRSMPLTGRVTVTGRLGERPLRPADRIRRSGSASAVRNLVGPSSDVAATTPALDSRGYLLGRAAVVEERVRALVAHRRSVDPAPDDEFRGLYISDAVVDALLGAPQDPPRFDGARRNILERNADTAEAGGTVLRLRDWRALRD